jgi:hypothetical protein
VTIQGGSSSIGHGSAMLLWRKATLNAIDGFVH